MAVTRGAVIHEFHKQSRAHGEMRVASDFSFQIDAVSVGAGAAEDASFDHLWLYTKSQFWPVLTPGEGIEVPTALGSAMWQPSQCKFHQQASITFQESADGVIQQFLDKLLECRQTGTATTSTGRFDAWVYYGTPESYFERRKIVDSFLVIDEATETNWESRTEILTLNAMLYYHYYGEQETGDGNLCEFSPNTWQ
jgi:hypothetical protein